MSLFELHPNIRIRIVTSFLTKLVGNMIFPFMAIYFSAKMGLALTGFLLSLTLLTQILLGFYGGYLADRWGRKKVMVYGQSVQCAAFLIMTLANSPWLDSAWLTFAMMLLQSASNGLISPAADAMLIDVSTAENRTFMYSINYWASNLSIAIGSVLGGLLFATHRFELFIALTLVSLFTLYMMSARMQESYFPQKDRAQRTPFAGANVLVDVIKSYRQVITDRRFLLYSLGGLFIFSLEFQTANYVAVRLSHEFPSQSISLFDWFAVELTGLKMFSLIQLENTLLVVLLSLFITRLIRHAREASAMYVGGLLYIVGYTVILYSNSLFLLMAAMLIATWGELIHIPTRQTFLARIVRDDARSSYMAVNGLVFQGARIIGTAGITLGAIFPSYLMALLFFLLGVTGMLIVRHVVSQLEQTHVPMTHAKEAAR
ncbi:MULTISPECIES: MDR family MFS transporter [Brevibacillus]|uniref:MDR family MFS transporter n=1 Tax=Brevibacillus TaxID=55080 RepID=UPI000EED6887|nr:MULTISPECIES: MFS transporter [Brevibacillus]MBU8716041.1 MFS transporter [Brevibacillus parabrevis]MDR5002607.1 MFS transporter [Brevibacillus parabrevis]MED2256919.1 MFS transporter [Brevibacillus parabrevis]UED69276.1 MFS transporter [Brevibacillus sp. HD3.3A]WDV95560.1 MFS transporter [Brevibacillus parabrevis]